MKRFLFFLLSLLIGIGLFVWVLKFVGWPEIKNAFLVFSGWQGMVIFGLTLLIMLTRGWVWREVLEEKKAKVSFPELFKIYLAAFSIRYLAPIITLGDEFLQGYVLKEKKAIPWTKGMSSVVIERILEWTINLLIIFFGLLFFFLTMGLPSKKVFFFLGGIFLFLVLGITLFYFKAFKKESIAKSFVRVFKPNLSNRPLEIEKEIFDFFNLKKMSMWKAFFISFLKGVLFWLRSWLLVIFLGKSISGLTALSVLGFSCLAMMVPIPAALGSHEAVQIFVFNSLRLGIPTATAFTMIIRGAEIIIALLGIVILYQLGVTLALKAFSRKINNLSNISTENNLGQRENNN